MALWPKMDLWPRIFQKKFQWENKNFKNDNSSEPTKNSKKNKMITDQPTNQPTDRHSGLLSRVARDYKEGGKYSAAFFP